MYYLNMIWKEARELFPNQKFSVSQLLTYKAFILLLKVATGNKDCPALLLQLDYETYTECFFQNHTGHIASHPQGEIYFSIWQLFP